MIVNAQLQEYRGLVSLIEPKDCEAGIDSESFNMSGLHRASLALQFGAVTGDAVLTVFVGATTGVKTTALTFRYRLSGADFKATDNDSWGAEASSAALTLAAATYDHRVLLIDLQGVEVDPSKPWVTLELGATASVLLLSAVGILVPRYAPPLTVVA